MIMVEKVRKISDKVTKKLTQFGSILYLVDIKPITEITNEQDDYSSFYGQTQNEILNVDEQSKIIIHSMVEYDPLIYDEVGGGTEAKYDIACSVTLKELLDNKLLGEVDMLTYDINLPKLQTAIKTHKMILLNDAYYRIDTIKPEAILYQSPIQIKLLCTIYSENVEVTP